MSETEAYLQLIAMAGLILLTPFFWRICLLLGKAIIIYGFPPKVITLEIKKANGKISKIKINTEDDDALIEAILNCTGRIVK
jgi:hypothetical protein